MTMDMYKAKVEKELKRDEDMIAKVLGMKVFLLSDCVVNRQNKDISEYPNGSFAELEEFLKKEEII